MRNLNLAEVAGLMAARDNLALAQARYNEILSICELADGDYTITPDGVVSKREVTSVLESD